MVKEAYMQELRVVLKHTLFVTLVTHVGIASSGNTSNNTCIQTELDILNPSIDKLIGHLISIVPSRTTLKKILSST